MSDDSVQNFANHARWLKPWHFFAVPVLAINAIVSLVTLAKGPSLGTLWASLVAIALMASTGTAKKCHGLSHRAWLAKFWTEWSDMGPAPIGVNVFAPVAQAGA